MKWDSIFWTKMIVVLLYFGGLFWIGVMASRKIQDMKDFFVAGKKLNYWLVSFSSRATGESAWLLLGLTGMGFAVGMHALWVVLGEVAGVTLCWVFLTQRFKVLTDRYDSITVTDYLSDRVRDTTHVIRILATVILVVFVTSYVSAQFAACGKAFKGFLHIPHHYGVILGMVIVGFYTVAGGFFAVAWSDLVQGILMLVGLLLIPIVALSYAGGWGTMVNTVGSIDPSLLTVWGKHGFGWAGVLSALALAAVGLGYLGSPQLFVRFIAVKSREELTNGTWIAVLFTILCDLGAVLAGVAGRALVAPNGALFSQKATLLQDAEQILPIMTNALFPTLLAGLFIAIVLAAIMSTADSLLVLVSSAVVRDTWQKVFRPETSQEQLTKLSRYVTFTLCLVALFPAFSEKSMIFWFVLFAWTGITSAFCPVLILSLYWKGLTRAGVIAGMVTGMALTIAWKVLPLNLLSSFSSWAIQQKIVAADKVAKATLHSVVDHMLIAFTGALLMAVVVSWFTTPPAEASDDLNFAKAESVDLLG
ncbi:MAG: sodium/proline symporter [Deltaproteobacteria bacterium]|nr:MAG: sodium/proline symporter [Deltaproteobacteria bacterium]